MVYILGIETSCDDTSAAITMDNKILANIIANQEVHKNFGGVVPEYASRAHQLNIVPVVDQALKKAGITKDQLNAVAFTAGPGLLGSLIVGVSFSKAFALGLDIPIIQIDHLNAHILAHFILHHPLPPSPIGEGAKGEVPSFPFLCLTVSGGHTQIVLVKDYFDYEILGQTIDDAAGETFDKAAKIFGLSYPGGPEIDKFAKQGDPDKFKFAKPYIKGLDFSFSGLKTSILYFIRDELKKDPDFISKELNNLCASVQKSIVDILLDKLQTASKQTGIKEIAIAGGVSANSFLRASLAEAKSRYNWNIYIPKVDYSTDNAAMIAVAGYYKYLKKEFASQDISPYAKAKQ
jgi:N6-L-threonylcarbamoyladenine synthase